MELWSFEVTLTKPLVWISVIDIVSGVQNRDRDKQKAAGLFYKDEAQALGGLTDLWVGDDRRSYGVRDDTWMMMSMILLALWRKISFEIYQSEFF